MAPRVGFRGLALYKDSAMARLDDRADELADRVDRVEQAATAALDKHGLHLDSQEAEIRNLERQVKELQANGGPPLDDSAKPSSAQVLQKSGVA